MTGFIATAIAALSLASADAASAQDHFVIKSFGPEAVKAGARYAHRGELDLAGRLTRRAIDAPVSGRSKAIAWANLCAIEARAGDLAAAGEACDAALAADPDSVVAYHNRAALYFLKGEYRLAERDAETVLARDDSESARALLEAVRNARARLAANP